MNTCNFLVKNLILVLALVLPIAAIANWDFDGDGKSDIMIRDEKGAIRIDFAKNGFGIWDSLHSGYGRAGDLTIGDYDGDGFDDLSIYHNNIWYIDYAENGFGLWDWQKDGYFSGPDDILGRVAQGDFDGDGKTDIAIVGSKGRASIDYATNGFGQWDWHLEGYSNNGVVTIADYDGDGFDDLSLYIFDGWYIDYAKNGFGKYDWFKKGYFSGVEDLAGRPTQGDYDGDGKADISIYGTDGTWSIDFSSNGLGDWDRLLKGYGYVGRSIVADYDGDGKADISIHDAPNYYVDYSENGIDNWDVTYTGYGKQVGQCQLNLGCPVTKSVRVVQGNDDIRSKKSKTKAIVSDSIAIKEFVWPTLNIPVCWLNPSATDIQYRELVRTAVTKTWELHSDYNFIGWQKCQNASKSIVIEIADTRSNSVLGYNQWRDNTDMELNFTYIKSSKYCNSDFVTWNGSTIKENCIYNTAVHEFGHALGFVHEQYHPGTPRDCISHIVRNEVNAGTSEQEAEKLINDEIKIATNYGLFVSGYDANSVMNYCQPILYSNSRTHLTSTDIKGLKAIQHITTSVGQKKHFSISTVCKKGWDVGCSKFVDKCFKSPVGEVFSYVQPSISKYSRDAETVSCKITSVSNRQACVQLHIFSGSGFGWKSGTKFSVDCELEYVTELE